MMIRRQTDIVVVGSGPGGATVARQLAKAGRRVLLLERGRDWRGHFLYGTYPGAMRYIEQSGLRFTHEGLNVIRPFMVGGATNLYCASAARPEPWWRDRYRIDLEPYAEETVRELHIRPLSPSQRGNASTRIAEAACELGMDWQPQDKFMQPERAMRFDCNATCMLGCHCHAKWTAAEYVDEAIAAGAELWTEALVDQVLVEDHTATGVRGRIKNRPFHISANTVVLAAGGLGSPVILRRSGFFAAGEGITMDTTVLIYGHAPYKGIGAEPPMTWSYAADDIGVMFATLVDPWLMYPIILLLKKGPAYPLTWYRWGHTLGVMVKLKDDVSGGVDIRGRVSKGLTARDQARLFRAEAMARQILERAGCDPDSIFTTPMRGTHPSSTVRIGEVVDAQLQTEVDNLYVCDASVFPEALARPTVLTIISLAKRLGDHLLQGDRSGHPIRRS